MYFDLLFHNIIKACGFTPTAKDIEKNILEYTYYKGDKQGRIVLFPTTLSEGCIFFYQTFGPDQIRIYGCASEDGNKLIHFDASWCSQFDKVSRISDIVQSFRNGLAKLVIMEDEYVGYYCEINTDCIVVRTYSEDLNDFVDGRDYLDHSNIQNGTSYD